MAANSSHIHISQTADGRWQAKREGGERASFIEETQAKAIEAAQALAKRENCEVIVHGRDGKIRKI